MQKPKLSTQPDESALIHQSLVWRMIFERPIELETVADSARRVDMRE